eukprot:gnl/TRDRNA2_/TRDRNA2_48189_c1_seq1.p1 gnl/TRDRNA2_/TRDRNA2_48189_c1~~gnl/TRDRNA2_/TRDRNA2_48189_c1_seq1.p1  ORF type:complete len:163 (+),score=33.78 gnl/TRDRNA2_/TRDRNA2_48189_c1_seq1:74-562(+)
MSAAALLLLLCGFRADVGANSEKKVYRNRCKTLCQRSTMPMIGEKFKGFTMPQDCVEKCGKLAKDEPGSAVHEEVTCLLRVTRMTTVNHVGENEGASENEEEEGEAEGASAEEEGMQSTECLCDVVGRLLGRLTGNTKRLGAEGRSTAVGKRRDRTRCGHEI